MATDEDSTRTGPPPSPLGPPPSLLRAVRRDPRHATELALPYALPQLSTNAERSAEEALGAPARSDGHTSRETTRPPSCADRPP